MNRGEKVFGIRGLFILLMLSAVLCLCMTMQVYWVCCTTYGLEEPAHVLSRAKQPRKPREECSYLLRTWLLACVPL